MDAFVDSVKLLPFLYIAFLLIEIIEHKFNDKKISKKLEKVGPFLGSVLGAIPQCGFSTFMTNLYATRVITLGTLISIYLSTSDEMIPIMLSSNVSVILIIKIIILKVLIGFIFGILIDFIIRKLDLKKKANIYHFCKDENCHCEDENLLFAAFKHTLSIGIFIFFMTFLLNMGFEYIGYDVIAKIFMRNNIFSSFIICLLGLIPNCGSSVIITELYLNNVISFGSLIGALLTGSGVSLLVLFKTNKDVKENIVILLLIYLIGSISGTVINLISYLF